MFWKKREITYEDIHLSTVINFILRSHVESLLSHYLTNLPKSAQHESIAHVMKTIPSNIYSTDDMKTAINCMEKGIREERRVLAMAKELAKQMNYSDKESNG